MIRTIGLYRAQQSARLGTERDAQGRVWCQLFPLGTWHRSDFPDGKLELTPQLLNEFIANWKAGGSPPLPVDYNHEEDGPAAGWIEDLRLSAAGELEGAIAWTDDAAADIKADKRRYLSPTWAMAHTNRRTGTKGGPWLYGAALLNDPFYDSMPRVAASANAVTTHQPLAREGKEQDMDKKRICAALGLKEECSDEEVMAAIEAACKARASAGEDAEKLTAAVKAKDDTEVALKAAQAEVATLRTAVLERDVDALIATGKAAGKALDAMKDFILEAAVSGGMDKAKKLIASVPVTVPLKAEGQPVVEEKPLDTEGAVKRFEALVEEQIKAGAKTATAYRVVASAHPELAAQAFPVTNSTR